MNRLILGCESKANAKEEHMFVEYVQPEELYEFYDLTLTVKSHQTKVNHSIVHELYTNLTNRFDETKKWCVNALGIEQEVCVCVCEFLSLCIFKVKQFIFLYKKNCEHLINF